MPKNYVAYRLVMTNQLITHWLFIDVIDVIN